MMRSFAVSFSSSCFRSAACLRSCAIESSAFAPSATISPASSAAAERKASVSATGRPATSAVRHRSSRPRNAIALVSGGGTAEGSGNAERRRSQVSLAAATGSEAILSARRLTASVAASSAFFGSLFENSWYFRTSASALAPSSCRQYGQASPAFGFSVAPVSRRYASPAAMNSRHVSPKRPGISSPENAIFEARAYASPALRACSTAAL